MNGYLLKPFSYEVFVEQLNKILTSGNKPNVEKDAVELAEVFLEAGCTKEAKEQFDLVLATRPDSARAHTGYAKLLAKIGHFDLAVEKLKEAIRYNPDYIAAYQQLWQLYKERGNVHAQMGVVLKLHELSPDNPKYCLGAAEAYLKMEDFSKSEMFFKRTIRLSPLMAGAFKGLGDLYMDQEEYDKAMENYHKALDLDKDDVSTLNSLGLAYVKKDLIKEGIAYYNIALRLEPANPKILFNLGYAYEKSDQLHLAERYYQEALVHDSTFDKAQRGLQRIKKMSKDQRESA